MKNVVLPNHSGGHMFGRQALQKPTPQPNLVLVIPSICLQNTIRIPSQKQLYNLNLIRLGWQMALIQKYSQRQLESILN